MKTDNLSLFLRVQTAAIRGDGVRFHDFAHLSDLVGFGFAVSGGLQIDDFFNPFPVKDAMATFS